MSINKKDPLFKIGDNVKLGKNGKICTINEVILNNNSIGYRVTYEGTTKSVNEKFLFAIKDPEKELLESFYSKSPGGHEDYHLFQTWFRLKRPVEGNFYSYLASKTIFNPYQFKPLTKFISPGSEGRLFIADEVGVGKTIETGIILIELLARGRIDRKSPILIVCPNSLGPKWAKEMRNRFNLNFHIHDSKSFRHFCQFAKDGMIPDGMVWSIVSLSLLRTERHYRNLQKLCDSRDLPLWSLVIIDESHHMRNSSTLGYQIGLGLSDLTEMMLMLSATPLNLRDEDLFNQMHILNPGLFPDIQIFNTILSPLKSINRCRNLLTERTKNADTQILNELLTLKTGPLGEAISNHPGFNNLEKRLLKIEILNPDEIAYYDRVLSSLSPLDNSFTRTLKREAIEHRVTREPIKVPVELTDEEMKVHDEVIELARDFYLQKGGEPSALGFITNIPRRMASSCLPAMRDYLHWCIDNNSVLTEGSYEDDDLDDDQGFNIVKLPSDLKERYIRLIDEIETINTDTKFDELLKLIKNLQSSLENPQIIIFSFFVRTLKYLHKMLIDEGYSVGLIYGDIPTDSDGNNPSRYQIMEAFERGEFDILLSSEVGGEGLDFQFCQAIINYDLPYNPMRIEQRIGRIDRFGQNSDKIFIASMYIQNSVDENIYTALYERINLIKDSIGTLEPILGTNLANLQEEIIQGSFTEEQLQERIREIEIAVEKAKIEKEKFEKNRMELMGDDYLSQIIQNLDSRTEFVQPIDAHWLTQKCLSSFPGCKFRAIDSDSCYITLSKEIVHTLEQYCRKPGFEGSLAELSRIFDSKYPLEVVFNGMIATERPSAVFFPPCGFWIKFLLEELEQNHEICFNFALSGNSLELGLNSGQYIIPFYEVMLEGFTSEINLLAVPVDIKNKIPLQCDHLNFSRILSTNTISSSKQIIKENPQSFIRIADNALDSLMEENMAELNNENRYRIQSRVNSVEKVTTAHIELLNKKIFEHYQKCIREEKTPSEKFIKLIESQKDIAKKKGEARINQIKEKNDLLMTKRIVAIASLEVV